MEAPNNEIFDHIQLIKSENSPNGTNKIDLHNQTDFTDSPDEDILATLENVEDFNSMNDLCKPNYHLSCSGIFMNLSHQSAIIEKDIEDDESEEEDIKDLSNYVNFRKSQSFEKDSLDSSAVCSNRQSFENTIDSSSACSISQTSTEDIFNTLQNSEKFLHFNDIVQPSEEKPSDKDLETENCCIEESQGISSVPVISFSSPDTLESCSLHSKQQFSTSNTHEESDIKTLNEENGFEGSKSDFLEDILEVLQNSDTFNNINDICSSSESREDFEKDSMKNEDSFSSNLTVTTSEAKFEAEDSSFHDIPFYTSELLSNCSSNEYASQVQKISQEGDKTKEQSSKESLQTFQSIFGLSCASDERKNSINFYNVDPFASQEVNDPPKKPSRKKKSPSVPSIPQLLSKQSASSFEITKEAVFPIHGIEENIVIFKPPRKKRKQQMSYSLSDINQIDRDSDLKPFDIVSPKIAQETESKIFLDIPKEGILSSRKSSTSHPEHLTFASPEVTSAVVEYDYIRPHNVQHRASICLMETPLRQEKTEDMPIPRKTPRFRRKSNTFTSADIYYKERRDKVINRNKTREISTFIRRTFSFKNISKSDNPPCMPNLLKRLKERRRRKAQERKQSIMPTIYEEPPIKRSETTESFASIFIADSDEESSNEDCCRRNSIISDWNFSGSLEFPNGSDSSLKRATSNMELSQILTCPPTPPKRQLLKRSNSFIQSTNCPKSFIKRFVTQDSTVSLNPEAIKRAQELLNKSIGVQPEEKSEAPIPPKRTKSKLSLNQSGEKIKCSNDCKLGSVDFAKIDKVKKKILLSRNLYSEKIESGFKKEIVMDHNSDSDATGNSYDPLKVNFHEHDVSLDNCRLCSESAIHEKHFSGSQGCLDNPGHSNVLFLSADNLNRISKENSKGECHACKDDLGMNKSFNLLKYILKSNQSKVEKPDAEDIEDDTELETFIFPDSTLNYTDPILKPQTSIFEEDIAKTLLNDPKNEELEPITINESIYRIGISYALAKVLHSSNKNVSLCDNEESRSSASSELPLSPSDYSYALDPVIPNTKIYITNILKAMPKLNEVFDSTFNPQYLDQDYEATQRFNTSQDNDQLSDIKNTEEGEHLAINTKNYLSFVTKAFLDLQADIQRRDFSLDCHSTSKENNLSDFNDPVSMNEHNYSKNVKEALDSLQNNLDDESSDLKEPVSMNAHNYSKNVKNAVDALQHNLVEEDSSDFKDPVSINAHNYAKIVKTALESLHHNIVEDDFDLNVKMYKSSAKNAYERLQRGFSAKSEGEIVSNKGTNSTEEHKHLSMEDLSPNIRGPLHRDPDSNETYAVSSQDSLIRNVKLYQENIGHALENICKEDSNSGGSVSMSTVNNSLEENAKLYSQGIERALKLLNTEVYEKIQLNRYSTEERGSESNVFKKDTEEESEAEFTQTCIRELEENTRIYQAGISKALSRMSLHIDEVSEFHFRYEDLAPNSRVNSDNFYKDNAVYNEELENITSGKGRFFKYKETLDEANSASSTNPDLQDKTLESETEIICSPDSEHHSATQYSKKEENFSDFFPIFQPLSLGKLASETYFSLTAEKKMLFKNMITSKSITDYLSNQDPKLQRKKSIGMVADSDICMVKLSNSVSSGPTIQHLCLGQPNYAKTIDSEYPCDVHLAHSQPPSLPIISEGADDIHPKNLKKSLLKRRSLRHSSENILKIVSASLNHGTYSKVDSTFYFPFRPNSALNSCISSGSAQSEGAAFPSIKFDFSQDLTTSDTGLRRSKSTAELVSSNVYLTPSSPTYKRIVKVSSPLSERKFLVCSLSNDNLAALSNAQLNDFKKEPTCKEAKHKNESVSSSSGVFDLGSPSSEGAKSNPESNFSVENADSIFSDTTADMRASHYSNLADTNQNPELCPPSQNGEISSKTTYVFPYVQSEKDSSLAKVEAWAELCTQNKHIYEEKVPNQPNQLTNEHCENYSLGLDFDNTFDARVKDCVDILLRTWPERQNSKCQSPLPVVIPQWAQNSPNGSYQDTPSPGPQEVPKEASSAASSPKDEVDLKEDKQKKEEERIQKDRCIEIYPETIRQRQRNMAPSPTKVDIKNFEGSIDNDDLSRGKKFLPSVKALRNQFENGKVSSTNGTREVVPPTQSPPTLGRSSSNSSSTSSLNNLHSLETSSGFSSMASSQTTTDSTSASKDVDEPVEPIFSQFKQVDQELKELMSKPPATSSWDAVPLVKKLYYVPEAPKMHSKGSNFINIEGYLEKLPSGRKKATFWNAWKRRYFSAKDGFLHYYQNNQMDKQSMKLSLMGGKVEIMDPNMVSVDDGEREDKCAGMLGIDDGKGHYVVVRCSSRQEAERWKHALETHTVDDFTRHFVQPWPRPTNPTLLRDTLIIDLGSCSVRAGVLASQATLPQVFFPSVLATNRESKGQNWGFEALSSEARSTSSITFPIRPSHKISKYSVDLTAVSSLIQKAFSDLKVDPKSYNIQLSVPRVLNPHTQAELLRILFEKFGVKAVNLTHQSILALYAYNASSGIVVDIGERLDVVPVIDGYIVDGGVSRVPYGGYRILEHLRQFLFQKNVSLVNEVESYVLRSVLESICYCAQHYNTEKARCTNNPQNFEKSIPLSDYHLSGPNCEAFQNISLDFGRFQATEGIFNPDAWGLDHPGLHKLVHKAIQECSMDIRKEMSRSIFLAGGVTQLPGMADRLSTELDNLTPTAIRPKVHSSPYRYHAAYLGACVLAESPAFAQSKITKEEWMKQGNSTLRKWAL